MQPITQILDDKNIHYTQIKKKDSFIIQQNWLDAFASRVKEISGSWIVGEYKWCAFDRDIQKSKKGSEAFRSYYNQPIHEYFIINESCSYCFLCRSEKYPDFSDLHEEIYIAATNMEWTMAFTHEPYNFGPYFVKYEPL